MCVCVFVNKLFALHELFEQLKVVENAFEWLYGANGVYKVFLVQVYFWLMRYDILIFLSQMNLMWLYLYEFDALMLCRIDVMSFVM